VRYEARKVRYANEGFGGVRAAAVIYFEHAGAEKHEVRYPSSPARITTALTSSKPFTGFTGSGDTADFIRRPDWTIVEKYQQLPGGVVLTIRPTEALAAKKNVFSLPNIHGDIMATTDAVGTSTGSYQNDGAYIHYAP
jgi:hypothetical protein